MDRLEHFLSDRGLSSHYFLGSAGSSADEEVKKAFNEHK